MGMLDCNIDACKATPQACVSKNMMSDIAQVSHIERLGAQVPVSSALPKKQFHSIQFRKNSSRYGTTNNHQSRTNHENHVKTMTSNQDMITVILTAVEVLHAPNYHINT